MDKRRTLSVKIIERFLNGKDYEEFLQRYDNFKNSYTLVSRKDQLSSELTPMEKEIMDVYFKEVDKPVRTIAKESGLTLSKVLSLVHSGSRKIAYKFYTR
jgi:hypothetical protein